MRNIKSKTYEEFVEKFKPKKTTDDCYTPSEIYEVIKDWVCKRYNIDPENVIRPFWPGGDYEKDEYPPGCVVVDNPPFSILKNICEFYLERGIPFFLFAPSLTALSGKTTWDRMNHIVCDCSIVYENGATVRTSFITSFEPETVAETSPELTRLVNDTVEKLKQEKARKLSKYDYPDHIVTASMMQKMAHFESVCKKKLVDWYNENGFADTPVTPPIDLSNVFVVWSCKTLQNYKCLVSTTVSGDGIYAEYTYNGDKQELYEDVYKKMTNTCYTEE